MFTSIFKKPILYKSMLYIGSLLYIALLFSCGFTKGQDTIIVYLDDDIVLADALIQEAYQTNGMRVEFVTTRSKQIINRRIAKFPDEAIRWRAKYILKNIDVFISTDFEFVNRLKQEGFFQDLSTLERVKAVREQFVDKAFQWVGVSARPKAVAYNASLSVNKEKFSLIQTYMELSTVSDKKVIASSQRSKSFVQFLAFLIHSEGKEAVDEWMSAIDVSLTIRPAGDEIRQIQYLDSDVALLTFVDMFNIKKMSVGYDAMDRSIVSRLGFIIPFDNLFLSINTMGIMESTNRLVLAKQFVDFLLSPSSQNKISTDNYDYPTVLNAKMSPFLSSWGAYPTIPWEHISDYYKYLPDAKALIEKYQW